MSGNEYRKTNNSGRLFEGTMTLITFTGLAVVAGAAGYIGAVIGKKIVDSLSS